MAASPSRLVDGRATRIALAWLALFLAVLVTPLAAVPATVPLTTVVSLNSSARENPEGLAVDKLGSIYVGLAFLGRVLRLAPDGSRSTLARLPNGQGVLIGLAVDALGNVYAALDSSNPATHGIWRVSRTGARKRIAALDPSGFANGLAFDARGNLFVSDSFLGTVWRIQKRGGAVSRWVRSPLLTRRARSAGYGANGLAFWRGDLYVANTDRASIVRVPVNQDGSAGQATVYVAGRKIAYADGIAFDSRGSLYVATSQTNTLVQVTPDRTFHTLATVDDGLDYPASLAFAPGERPGLYITNGGLNKFRPGVIKADLPK